MHYILLVTLATISLVISQPINIMKTESDVPSYDVIYVPYDVEYVPIEIQTKLDKSSNYKESFKTSEGNVDGHLKPIVLDDTIFKVLQNFKNVDKETSNGDSKLVPAPTLQDYPKRTSEHTRDSDDSTEDKISNFKLSEHTFNTVPSTTSEDFVLVPVSPIRKLQDDLNVDLSKKSHIITKRQAPDDSFYVYRPVVQYRRVLRDRRRVYRRPALVGYLNDYDNFPTVAV